MPGSKLVEALRSGDESEVLEALFQDADKLLDGRYIHLRQIEPAEGETLIRKGGIATRLAFTFHPFAYVREIALRTISAKDGTSLEARLRDLAQRMFQPIERIGLDHHARGYVREAAIRVLNPGDGTKLATFLRLSADWVPEIANLAQRKARAAFSVASDDELAEALHMMYGLSRRQRLGLDFLVDDYVAEVGRRDGLTRRVRRAHRWGKIGLWTYQIFGGRSELSEGINDANALVQLEAARLLVQNPEEWPKLISSRLPMIRRMGLDIAPTKAREAALLDAHAGVRNDARYLLGKRDYADFYRSHLPSPGAISGLGETGSKVDAKILAPFLFDPKSDIRRRAVESYARLSGDAAATELLVALQDPNRKVQRAAISGLAGIVISIDPEQILDLNLGTSGTWALMDRCPRWSILLTVLSSPERFPRADQWLLRWAMALRSRPLPPSSGQAEAALARLPMIADSVSERTMAELQSAIHAWIPT